MPGQWTLTGREFTVLWKDMREVLLPAPFTYLSDTKYLVDGERRNHETREHLRRVDNYGLEDVFEIVARADLRIILHAWDPQDPEDPEGHIRLHAVRRSHRTYLLEQLPGKTVQHSGGFTITECSYLTVAELMVARLPARPAGRYSDLALHSDAGLFEEVGRSQVREPRDDPSRIAAQQFTRAALELTGAVEIRQGLAPLGPKYRAHRGFWLRDLVDDGRYIVEPGRSRKATGADSSRVADRIDSAVAEVIVAIKEQRSRG
jgi:hypothetical protein